LTDTPQPARSPGLSLCVTRRSVLLAILVLPLSLLVLSDRADAQDRVNRLIQILQADSSYKVRMQAAITLGRLKERRAVPALIRALGDDNETVRGVTCAALAAIGDARAIPELKRRAREDSNAFVRAQAEKAVKTLAGAGGPPAGARFFLTLGKLTNKASKGGSQATRVLGDALMKEFSRVSGVATDWGGRLPSGAELSKRKVKGFVLDGSILSLTARRTGSSVEISCSIKVSMATFPGNSMKAFYTGGASTEVSASSYRPEAEDGLFKDVLEGAAQGAREHIVQSFLNTQ
jgi:hypothetical protein